MSSMNVLVVPSTTPWFPNSLEKLIEFIEIVVLMIMANLGERIQSKISVVKRSGVKSGRNQVHASKSPLPVDLHRL